MGIDIKDITDILPFILDNMSVCAYIIIISIILGFFVGKQFEKYKQKKRVNVLESQLINQKENVKNANLEKEQLKKEIAEMSKKCEILRNKTKIIDDKRINTNIASLASLERMLDSKEGQIELTALIELSYKKDKQGKDVEVKC